MTPDLAYWGRTLAWLAVEAGLLVGLAAWLASRLHTPRHRRTAWLTTFSVLSLVVAGEFAGARDAFHALRSESSRPREVVTRFLDDAPAFPNLVPDPDSPLAAPDQPDAVWWPGIAWLAGFLVVTAHRSSGLIILNRRGRLHARASREATDDANYLAQRLRLGPVTVLSWPELRGPVAFGWRRRFVALPADFHRRFDRTQREAILLHELAHLAMRDPLVQALTGIVCALLWWHPAVWWAHRRLTSAMEATADEASTLIPGGRTALAESLVRLGRELTLPSPTRALGVDGASTSSELAVRVRALLATPTGWRRSSWAGRIGVLFLASVLSMGAFAWNRTGSDEVPLVRVLLAQARLSDDATDTQTSAQAPSSPISQTNPAIPDSKEISPSSPKAVATPVATSANSAEEEDIGIRWIHEKLDQLILPRVFFPNTPLPEVIKTLQRLTEEEDLGKRGLLFQLIAVSAQPQLRSAPKPDLLSAQGTRIRMEAPVENKPLREVLNAIVASADTPIEYEVHPNAFGITFKPSTALPLRLITRTFKFDGPALLAAIDPDTAAPTTSEGATRRIGRYLFTRGISLEPPRMILFNVDTGLLMARLTTFEMDQMENVVEGLLIALEQKPKPVLKAPLLERTAQAPTPVVPEGPIVTLEVKFLEVTDRGAEDLGLDWLFGQTSTNAQPLEVVPPSGDLPGATSAGAANIRVERGRLEGQATVLSADQLKALLQRLERRGGVDIVAAPRVTTVSGRRAQVQINEVRTVVTEARTFHGQGKNQPAIHYGTDILSFGPSVDVLPNWRDDAWHLSVLGRVTEFLGYDDPKDAEVEARNDMGEKITGQLPLPRLRVRETFAEGRLATGQTLMLRGPVSERIHKTKGSWFRPSRTDTESRRLYVLVSQI